MCLVGGVFAQPKPKVGIVDWESKSLQRDDRQTKLQEIKTRLLAKRPISLVSESEIAQTLSTKNTLKSEVESKRNQDNERIQSAREVMVRAEDFYRASKFEESLEGLNAVIDTQMQYPVVADKDLTQKALSLMGVCLFFMGAEDKARNVFGALADLDPEYDLSEEQYPPPVLALFKEVKSAQRFRDHAWRFESSQKQAKALLMGYERPVNEEEGNLVVSLPAGHPFLGKSKVALIKDDFAPVEFSIDALPLKIDWKTLKDTSLPTDKIFSLSAAKNPSAQLKALLSKWDSTIAFMGRVEKGIDGRWGYQGLWLDSLSLKSSPVVSISDVNDSKAQERFVDELLLYLGDDLRVIASDDSEAQTRPSLVQASKPFYQTWWFWTLAGVGLTGVGLGTYFMLTAETTHKFSIVGPTN